MNSRNLAKLPLLIAIGSPLLLGACATQTANYDAPSRLDLLFRYDQLKEYLAARRALLEQMRADLTFLDEQLLYSARQLSDARELLAQARANNRASNAVLQLEQNEIDSLQRQVDAIYFNILQKTDELAELEDLQIKQNSERVDDQRKISLLKSEISRLQDEYLKLRSAVDRKIESNKRLLLKKEESL